LLNRGIHMKKILLLLMVCSSTAFADYGIEKVTNEAIPSWTEYSARATHSDKVGLVAEESGYISRINFKNGDKVNKGDIIIELENKDLNIEYTKAKTILNMAKTTYDKYQNLYAKELVSEPELFNHKQEYINCKSEYDLIKNRISDTKIVAKNSGLIGNIDLEPGDYVDSGTIVAVTASSSTMDMIGHVASKDINKIKIGSPVNINFESANTEVSGVITEINPFIDEELKKFEVTAEFKVDNDYLLDNTYGQIRIEDGERQGIKIPASAVLYYDLDTYVYLVEERKAKRQRVTLGRELFAAYVVESGLNIGDEIVTKDLYNLTEGQNIK